MYGTTMKNYNVNKASITKDERKEAFSQREAAVKNKKSKKTEEKDTRYVKIKSSSKTDNVEIVDEHVEESGFSRKDFPIPSVIITVLMTMMLLVVTVGLLGV